jgi:hypothetical protein
LKKLIAGTAFQDEEIAYRQCKIAAAGGAGGERHRGRRRSLGKSAVRTGAGILINPCLHVREPWYFRDGSRRCGGWNALMRKKKLGGDRNTIVLCVC